MKDSVALNSLIPISVVAVGLDMVSGWLVLNTYILPFLSQNGL
jgi:hypothetical protein